MSDAAAGDGIPLSIVVIMFSGPEALERCLQALSDQRDAPQPEILVPCDDTLPGSLPLAGRFPSVRFLRVAGKRTPAELRAHAVAQARGRVVALVEDHCMPDPEWCARIIDAHRAGHAAVGGSVEKGFAPGSSHDTALDWAVYLTDYSRYMNPLPEGPAATLTDCNVSYKRQPLESIREVWDDAFHENLVNGRLHKEGESLWLDPRIIVRNYRPLTLRAAIRDRYSFGRLFAATRVAGRPFANRFVYAAVACIMPPILAARAANNLRVRRRHQGQIVRCAPALLFVASVWMFGEMIGYLTGSPRSIRQPDSATK